MYFFIIGVAVSILDYQVSGQNASCNSQNCTVNIARSNFTSGDNYNYTITGQAAWVTDGMTSGSCSSVSSIYPAWKAEFGQNRTVSRIKIFWEDQQVDITVNVGGRRCHTPDSNYKWMPEYTLVCDVPVTGDYLLIYRQPTVGMLNLTLCEVEIYATPSPETTTHGPSSTTISSTPAIASSTGESTRDAIATLTITLDTTTTTISSTPATVSPTYESTSDAIQTPTTTLDTASTTTHHEAGTPAMSPYENSQTEATKSLYFTPSSDLYQSYASHVVAPSPTVSPDTASIPTSAMSSSPTNRQNSFTWPSYSLSSTRSTTVNSNLTASQSSTASLTSLMSYGNEPTTLHLSTPNLSATTTHSSLNVQPFRSTPTFAVLTTTAVISNSATLSNHDITLATNEASTPHTTFQNVSISPSTVSMNPTSATTSTANTASETNTPATSTGSVTPTPVTSKTTLTTILTSNGGTPTTTTTKPATDGTTPNIGQVSGTNAPKAANMNIVVIVATVGGCVMLLYIVGMTVFVLRQKRKDVYRPGQAE